MHHYYIKIMGGDVIYVDKDHAEDISVDIANGKNLTYKGRFIPNHQIVDAGFIEPYKERLDSDFDRAGYLLPNNRPQHDPVVREELRGKIRETLESTGDRQLEFREYSAIRKLANKLHNTKEWDLKTWEEFNETHPNPQDELDQLTKQENNG